MDHADWLNSLIETCELASSQLEEDISRFANFLHSSLNSENRYTFLCNHTIINDIPMTGLMAVQLYGTVSMVEYFLSAYQHMIDVNQIVYYASEGRVNSLYLAIYKQRSITLTTRLLEAGATIMNSSVLLALLRLSSLSTLSTTDCSIWQREVSKFIAENKVHILQIVHRLYVIAANQNDEVLLKVLLHDNHLPYTTDIIVDLLDLQCYDMASELLLSLSIDGSIRKDVFTFLLQCGNYDYHRFLLKFFEERNLEEYEQQYKSWNLEQSLKLLLDYQEYDLICQLLNLANKKDSELSKRLIISVFVSCALMKNGKTHAASILSYIKDIPLVPTDVLKSYFDRHQQTSRFRYLSKEVPLVFCIQALCLDTIDETILINAAEIIRLLLNFQPQFIDFVVFDSALSADSEQTLLSIAIHIWKKYGSSSSSSVMMEVLLSLGANPNLPSNSSPNHPLSLLYNWDGVVKNLHRPLRVLLSLLRAGAKLPTSSNNAPSKLLLAAKLAKYRSSRSSYPSSAPTLFRDVLQTHIEDWIDIFDHVLLSQNLSASSAQESNMDNEINTVHFRTWSIFNSLIEETTDEEDWQLRWASPRYISWFHRLGTYHNFHYLEYDAPQHPIRLLLDRKRHAPGSIICLFLRQFGDKITYLDLKWLRVDSESSFVCFPIELIDYCVEIGYDLDTIKTLMMQPDTYDVSANRFSALFRAEYFSTYRYLIRHGADVLSSFPQQREMFRFSFVDSFRQIPYEDYEFAIEQELITNLDDWFIKFCEAHADAPWIHSRLLNLFIRHCLEFSLRDKTRISMLENIMKYGLKRERQLFRCVSIPQLIQILDAKTRSAAVVWDATLMKFATTVIIFVYQLCCYSTLETTSNDDLMTKEHVDVLLRLFGTASNYFIDSKEAVTEEVVVYSINIRKYIIRIFSCLVNKNPKYSSLFFTVDFMSVVMQVLYHTWYCTFSDLELSEVAQGSNWVIYDKLPHQLVYEIDVLHRFKQQASKAVIVPIKTSVVLQNSILQILFHGLSWDKSTYLQVLDKIVIETGELHGLCSGSNALISGCKERLVKVPISTTDQLIFRIIELLRAE